MIMVTRGENEILAYLLVLISKNTHEDICRIVYIIGHEMYKNHQSFSFRNTNQNGWAFWLLLGRRMYNWLFLAAFKNWDPTDCVRRQEVPESRLVRNTWSLLTSALLYQWWHWNKEGGQCQDHRVFCVSQQTPAADAVISIILVTKRHSMEDNISILIN